MSELRRDKSDGNPTFGWDFWKVFIPFLILIVIVLFFPYLITQKSWVDFVFTEKSGWIGDTLGGVMGPFVAMIAAGLTFMAFWVQYKANEQQRNDIRLERFENKFYEMLRLHKANVDEISFSSPQRRGKKAFVWMYNEFRFIYKICESCYGLINALPSDKEKKQYTPQDITRLAYVIFFFGVGEISERGIEFYAKSDFDSELTQRIISELKRHQETFLKRKSGDWADLKANLYKSSKPYVFTVNFYPFDGHVSKLAHYFRHLYQTIKMATTDPVLDNIDPAKERRARYEYVKLIRVQLSNHEQTMIYYNSFFDAGKVWWGDKTIEKKTIKNGKSNDLSYFLDYGMIKNLPFNLTEEIGPNPIKEFFSRLVERGFDVKTEAGKVELMKFLDEKLFEWGVSKQRFDELVAEHLTKGEANA